MSVRVIATHTNHSAKHNCCLSISLLFSTAPLDPQHLNPPLPPTHTPHQVMDPLISTSDGNPIKPEQPEGSDGNPGFEFYPGSGDKDDIAHNIYNVPMLPLWSESLTKIRYVLAVGDRCSPLPEPLTSHPHPEGAAVYRRSSLPLTELIASQPPLTSI